MSLPIKDETRQILCDPELLSIREEHLSRMAELFRTGDGGNGNAYVLSGVPGLSEIDIYENPEAWMVEALDGLAARADEGRNKDAFLPLYIESWLYGVHFTDRMFGADVFELHEKNNWQAHYLETSVGELQPVDLDNNETWAQAQRLARAFADADVTVPLFGLPVIGSAFNQCMNLYGQDLLLAMMTDPEAAHHDLRLMNGVLCDLHRWHLDNLPHDQMKPILAAGTRTQPPGFGQMCGCATQLLSGELYGEFCAPRDNEILSVYPEGGLIHLCGSHTQHIPVWREMESVRALQLNDRAAEDLETYFREMREDQIFYLNPCSGMPVKRILEITGGRRVVLAIFPDLFQDYLAGKIV